MPLPSRASNSALPSIPKKFAAITSREIISALAIASGRDEAWQFMPLAELAEVQEKLFAVIPEKDRKEILKSSRLPGSYEYLSDSDDFFKRVITACRLAHERKTRWEEDARPTIDCAPITIRYLVRLYYSCPGERILDTTPTMSTHRYAPGAATFEILDCLHKSPGGKERTLIVLEKGCVTEAAKVRLIGLFSKAMTQPHHLAALSQTLQCKPELVAAQLLVQAEQHLLRCYGGEQKQKQLSDSNLKAIEPSSYSEKIRRAEREGDRSSLIRLCDYALRKRSGEKDISDLHTVALEHTYSILKEAATPAEHAQLKALADVAALALSKRPAAFTDYSFFSDILDTMRSPYAFSQEIIPFLKKLAEPLDDSTTKELMLPIRRQALSLAGYYLEHVRMSPKARKELGALLTDHLSHHEEKIVIECALYCIVRNYDVLPRAVVSNKIATLLDEHGSADKVFQEEASYEFLISCDNKREKERISLHKESLGILEAIVAIRDRDETLDPELLSKAYQLGLNFIEKRKAHSSGAHNRAAQQQQVALTLCKRLNDLCDGAFSSLKGSTPPPKVPRQKRTSTRKSEVPFSIFGALSTTVTVS
jgi:hypothetical protein